MSVVAPLSSQLASAAGARVVVNRSSRGAVRRTAAPRSQHSHSIAARVGVGVGGAGGNGVMSICATARASAASVAVVATPHHRQQQQQCQHRSARGASVVMRADAVAAAPASIESSGGKPALSPFVVGILWFFAHQLIGVGNDVIMKSTGTSLGVAQVVFMRFAFATLTMLPVMLSSGKEGARLDAFKTDRVPLHVARSVLLAAGIALYCKGLAIAPLAVVTTLNFTIPLFTLVLARVVLKETVDATRWIGTLVGFAGVMVVVQPGAAAFNPMWLIVLLSAAMFASLDVLNKIFIGKESFWAMIFYTALFTTLLAAVPAALAWVTPTLPQLGLLALLGAGANLLLYCLLKSFSLVDASALAPFRYTELMWSAAVGALIFGEIPAMSTLVGAAVIIPSTLYVVWAENQKAKSSN